MKVFFLLILAASLHAEKTELLVARYTAVKGSDPEYGQGAIEKCDVRHAEIAKFVWIIEVPSPADPGAWQSRLNEVSKHGTFSVRFATDEERESVRSGKVKLQR